MSLAASNRVTSDDGQAPDLPSADSKASQARNDDDALVLRFRAGDAAALGPLIEKYQDRVYRTCLRICGRPDDAADLTQDVFVRVFETLGGFAGRSGFYTWVFRIAVNLSISHRRKAGPRRTISLDAARPGFEGRRDETAGERLTTPGGTAEQALASRERNERVAAALAELEEDHRAILVLRDVEDFDYDQIAEILELPVGTVKSRLHRARLALKECIERSE